MGGDMAQDMHCGGTQDLTRGRQLVSHPAIQLEVAWLKGESDSPVFMRELTPCLGGRPVVAIATDCAFARLKDGPPVLVDALP